MSTPTSRPGPAAAGLAAALLLAIPTGLPAQQHRSGKRLSKAELVQLLDCLTRKELVPLGPQYSRSRFFRVRYLSDPGTIGGIRYPDSPPLTYPETAIELVVYPPDGKSAVFYETQIIRGPGGCHRFQILNLGVLGREKNAWRVREVLDGLGYTMARIQSVVNAVARTPLVTVPVAEAAKTCATCEMGLPY